MCVGEVQSGVEHEVGLDNVSRSLTDVIEEASASHRHSALISVLQGGKQKKDIIIHSQIMNQERYCTGDTFY